MKALGTAIGAAIVGATLAGVLVVLYRETLEQHVEAWRFQWTRTTETVSPSAPVRTMVISSPLVSARRLEPGSAGRPLPFEEERHLLQVAANELRCPVIFDPDDVPASTTGYARRTVCNIRGVLAREGWRLVEQRLPRRAYILVRADRGAPAPRSASSLTSRARSSSRI